jgi:hypothetical protein
MLTRTLPENERAGQDISHGLHGLSEPDLCNLWLKKVAYWSLSGLLKPKSASSPSEAIPPPASDE